MHTDYETSRFQAISSTIRDYGCQPILFIGSGLSRRYIKGPSWNELLEYVIATCPRIDKALAYYQQIFGDPLKIGSAFAKEVRLWAWEEGKNQFPASAFGQNTRPDFYLKYLVCEKLRSLTAQGLKFKQDFDDEIAALQRIRPHSIITTNFDHMIEELFPEFEPVIGEQIFRSTNLSIAEIFKIHGCVTDPETIVLTQEDYEHFIQKKKYLSAKLLTFFSEHPVFFLGYSIQDPNIRAILSDVDEILADRGGRISNVFLVEWTPDPANIDPDAREVLVAVGEDKSVRLNYIQANSFEWIFDAIGSHTELENVSPKLLRSLLARSYHLVRHDIPRKTVEANFEMLEHAVESPDNFAKLFGITTIEDPSALSAKYPYNLTEVAKNLGFHTWNKADDLIKQIRKDKGVDIKSSDNRYHYHVSTGGKGSFRKYSEEAVVLLKKVRDGEDYSIEAV